MSKKKLEENIKFWISKFISRNKDYDLKEIFEFKIFQKLIIVILKVSKIIIVGALHQILQ